MDVIDITVNLTVPNTANASDVISSGKVVNRLYIGNPFELSQFQRHPYKENVVRTYEQTAQMPEVAKFPTKFSLLNAKYESRRAKTPAKHNGVRRELKTASSVNSSAFCAANDINNSSRNERTTNNAAATIETIRKDAKRLMYSRFQLVHMIQLKRQFNDEP